MDEIDILIEIARNIGIPALFACVLLGLGLRYAPKFLDAVLTDGAERRKLETVREERIVEVAAREELALRQNSEVIARNSEVVGHVAQLMAAVTEAVAQYAAQLREHDRRAEEIGLGVAQILENARRGA
ncbi:MAG: hypothetical protein LBN30_04335 [Oscillospiraceae bacterium]|jgi:hypothetical protein|nr:hypothetical protein [Oscillospiraceae bacterium]